MGEPEPDGPDRRRGPRIPRKSQVVHRTLEFPEPPGRTGRLRDVSPTGARFESDFAYPAGEALKLEMTLPGWEQEKIDFYTGDPREGLKPLVALAEVRWVKPLGAGLFEVGARFTNVDEWHRQALRRYLEKIEEQARDRPKGPRPPRSAGPPPAPRNPPAAL
ncbi:MAG: PilZ domain-containing protein [Planctomycetes bacterium]|jgi:hypothetical protein|nr:PilZ domain-containing protein [Planctomycetota bacterium]